MHFLPHANRSSDHARDRHAAPRLHGLPRRKRGRASSFGRRGRITGIRTSEAESPPAASRSKTGGPIGESRALYTQWLKESPEYVRFVNPGDLRIAPETCGRAGCHPSEVRNVSTSMMTTGGILWGAALYNNGGYPHKDTRFGESYARDGAPQTVRTIPQPSTEETRTKGVLPEITPLERWEISQPGNVLRVFERGGGPKGEVGEPSRDATETGKPDDKLSTRGFGTLLRTDPVFLGLQKTRLLDPLLSMPGTNDSRATIAPADARLATLYMRMIDPRNIPRSMRHSAIAATARRTIRRFRAKSPATPSATNSRARSRRASAWSAMSIRART